MKSAVRLACVMAILSLGTTACSVSSDSLIFTTYTKVGLDVTATGATPTEAVFGYKRFEGAIIPVEPPEPADPNDPQANDPKTHSVFAGLCIKNGWLGGLDIHQVFATGAAAEKTADRDQTALAGVLDCEE